ncbi:hypothetical protein UUU_22120 [Klebsiella pneumoniae subsp. pneumoniae DSM 30104 = JCM 1662 = NBRC 14940]|nr:hypothetical protein UUU_22120 [Klebsiella pneumoniae subsp. pneumoniae DSM 30104 = JCM 1662 = NBRC 14940]
MNLKTARNSWKVSTSTSSKPSLKPKALTSSWSIPHGKASSPR